MGIFGKSLKGRHEFYFQLKNCTDFSEYSEPVTVEKVIYVRLRVDII